MAFQYLLVHREGPVGWLEFNRPPINAFHWEMVREVPRAFAQLRDDPAVRVIVFASALEKYFSVGADLEWFANFASSDMAEWAGILHELVKDMRASPKPLLAAVHGTAVGGGIEMTLHCDLRFAADDARLGQPEVNINLVPPIATTQSLVRLMGRPQAIRYLYDGELISARDAQALGLVDTLVEPAKLREVVQAYGEKLAARPAEALEAIRRTITAGMDLPFEEAMRIEYETVVRLAGTDNFAEGVRAFLEKRKPRWT